MRYKEIELGDLFEVQSGDYHATKELDEGSTPLISCGDTNNGLIGYFEIPEEKTYRDSITVAYNGSWPLMAKFHPYQFGAKDDVAVLIPRKPMQTTTLLFIAVLLNNSTWRYSYGRKCFKEKLGYLTLTVPVVGKKNDLRIDEAGISKLFTRDIREFIPKKENGGVKDIPDLNWKAFNIRELFDPVRGDFHSITALDEGEYMTVSRVTDENGVVGYFERPEDASVYGRGLITISTVGGDAFVQLDDFIATDNVLICTPRRPFRITTLFFVAFMLNHQRWRYSYGRQCYEAKMGKVSIYLPVKPDGDLDEDAIEKIVKQASYWKHIGKRFPAALKFQRKAKHDTPFLPGL